jgi:glycosyltransferase involved in cell wall biosynthesis
MKVGIVIITYNNKNHIAHTIASVREQLLEDWVAVVVDNGSTDGTFARIGELIEGDSRFTAYRKTNEGPAAGRNLGYSKLPTQVEFLHFLDGDDVLKNNFLLELTKYLRAHPEVGMVACQFDEIDEKGKYLGKGHRSRYAPNAFGIPHDIPLRIRNTPFVSFFSSTGIGPYVVYRKSVFARTNGFELKSQEDTDMYCKMSLLAEVHYLPEYLYKKRRHPNNLAHKKSYTSTHQAFRNKWDFYQSDDAAINRLIEDSLKYYYTRHTPLRDFKVSAKSLKKALLKMDLEAFKWSLTCLNSGMTDVFFQKSYKSVMKKRIAIQQVEPTE